MCVNLEIIQAFKSVLNSAILMSECDIEFHLIIDDFFKPELESLYSALPETVRNRVKFTYYNILFPLRNYDWWKNMYRPCTAQKVFIPKVIRENVKSVIYLDVDIIITARLEKIWDKWNEFEPEQILGASHDCPFNGCAYYLKVLGKKLAIPVVGNSGLNAGVLFMRLDLMRNSNFVDAIVKVADGYKDILPGAEQDMLNIIFSKNMDKFKLIDCSYNYFPHFYCNKTNMCDRSDAIKIIHGAGKLFDVWKTFSISKLYHYIRDIDFNIDKSEILNELRRKVNEFLVGCKCESIIDKLFLY